MDAGTLIQKYPTPVASLRVQTIEVGVFLLLIVPSLVISLFLAKQGGLGFSIAALATIFRDTALVCLILYFLWRNGESVVEMGWVLRRAWREVLLGLVFYAPFFLATTWLEQFLVRLGFSTPAARIPAALRAQGVAEEILAAGLVVVVAIAEETVFRGYLILRLRPLVGAAGAVVLSSMIFAIGHGYEGSAGVVTVGVMGAIFAVIYLWRGSLIAPIVMHFLQDFLGIVLVPLLKGS